MDKKLYKELREKQKYYSEAYSNHSKLSNFIKNYETFFEEEKSIDALKKIKEYIKSLWESVRKTNDDIRRIKRDLRNTCDHEVVVYWEHVIGNECLLCGNDVNIDSEKNKNIKLIIEKLDSYEYRDTLKKLCDELIDTDQDVTEGVLEKVREINDKKVIIRRR